MVQVKLRFLERSFILHLLIPIITSVQQLSIPRSFISRTARYPMPIS